MSVTAPALETPWQPPERPAFDPQQGDLTREYGMYPTEAYQGSPHTPSMPADYQRKMLDAGWWQCPTQKDPSTGQPCGFWLNPQAKEAIESHNGYFTCPKCKHSYNLMEELPWHGVEDADEAFGPNTATAIGIPKTDQAQIGEDLVKQLGTIPGYGPIVSWHPGGAAMNAPLDGATSEWGIEVKTISYDATHHRFAPGGEGATPQHYKQEKDRAAMEMGLKGVLGILVLLDYRRDVADIYAKAMPLEPWETSKGRYTQGVAQFRKDTAEKLVAEVPFKSPYKNPHDPSPGPYRANDFYEKPQRPQAEPEEAMPF